MAFLRCLQGMTKTGTSHHNDGIEVPEMKCRSPICQRGQSGTRLLPLGWIAQSARSRHGVDGQGHCGGAHEPLYRVPGLCNPGSPIYAMNRRMEPQTDSNCRSSMRPSMFRMTVPITFCTPDRPSAADCCITKFALVALSDCRKY